MDKAFEDLTKLHHDVGFMWHISSGASYQLTGNMASRNRDVLGAMSLMSRYNVNGDFIRSWNGNKTGWTIIDCMMNIPQLYWASEQIGDTRFKKIAVRYADMAMRDHVRPDGSVNHIVVHDTEQPDTVIETKGGQGYGVGSTWSRGAAWALYGFILSYIHTKEERYLETAKKVAHYFIVNLEKSDWKALCDFRSPEEPVIYDSSAAAIAACGMIEIAKAVPEFEKDIYLNAAIKTLKALDKDFCCYGEEDDSIVLKGTVMYTAGHHRPLVYAYMFYAEALLKLKGSEFLIW
jgi:unsaturated chondroitin disaccharide hydrolase